MIKRSALFVCAAAAFAGLVTACGEGNDGPVRVSVIGKTEQIAAPLSNASTEAGAVSLAATARGLVTLDAKGDVIPGLAQRWIVVDGGSSYIFRLRRARWINDDRVVAREVKTLLEQRLRAMRKIDPYGSLASVSRVLAMTDDVLEIRLATPRPNFLQALAQPQMAIARSKGGSGPYRKSRNGETDELLLTPEEAPGAAEKPPEPKDLRLLQAERAAKAVVRFENGGTDLVLGGTLADLPYVTLAQVDGRSVRFDPVQGLFGLALSRKTPAFRDPQVREALSMAIEREAIIGYFNISRWKIADHILPQQFNLLHEPTNQPWTRMSIGARREQAIGTVTRWRAQHDGQPLALTISLPVGPGMDLLFLSLRAQFLRVGVRLERVERNADLTLIDEVAPYDSVAWFLGRVSCARDVHCSDDAEDLLKASLSAPPEERLRLLGEAEPLIEAHGGFIPLATPVRWSLVSQRIEGFAPSPRGRHSLMPLTR